MFLEPLLHIEPLRLVRKVWILEHPSLVLPKKKVSENQTSHLSTENNGFIGQCYGRCELPGCKTGS